MADANPLSIGSAGWPIWQQATSFAVEERSRELGISSEVIASLAAMPLRFERDFCLIPRAYTRWKPDSTDKDTHEFSAIELARHLLDVETEGYQVRIQRMLKETNPWLAAIDGRASISTHIDDAVEPREVLAEFRAARRATVRLIQGIDEYQMERQGYLRGHGQMTLRGLIYYLCSHDLQHLACLQWLLGRIDSQVIIGAFGGHSAS